MIIMTSSRTSPVKPAEMPWESTLTCLGTETKAERPGAPMFQAMKSELPT